MRQFLATLGVEVGSRHHLYVRVVLEEEHGAERAHAVPRDAHAYLLIAERLPRAVRLRLARLVEALDLANRIRRGSLQARRRDNCGRSDEEIPSCDVHVFSFVSFGFNRIVRFK